MLRFIVGGFLTLHAVAHLVPLMPSGRTTLLWGTIELGTGTAKALAFVWLAAALAFLTAAVGVALRASWAASVTGAAAILSAVLCLAWSPAAIAGLVIDLVILVGLLGSTELFSARPR